MITFKQPKGIEKKYLFSAKDIAALLIPLMVEQLLMVLVGIADTVMISSVGEAAVSAISLIDSLVFLFLTIFTALAIGGAVIIGQYLGRKNTEEATHSAAQLIIFSFIIGMLVCVVLEVFHNGIISLLFGSVSGDVFGYSVTYLRITNLSLPIYSVYIACGAIFRAVGNSRITMLISMIMNVINVAGNAICIFGIGMEVEGAAIPTLVARVVAGVILFLLILRPNATLNIKEELRSKPDLTEIKRMLRIAVPSGIESSSFQFGKLILSGLVSTLGTASITANAVTGNFTIMNIVPGIAIGLGTVTVVSRCIGAGDYEQAKYYHRLLHRLCYLTVGICSIAVLVFSDSILNLYNLSGETHSLAVFMISIHSVGSIFLWTPAFHSPNTLRSAGDVRYCMVASVFSMFIFRVLAAYILAIPLGIGVAGVWMAMMIDWVVRTIFFQTRLRGDEWMKKKVI